MPLTRVLDVALDRSVVLGYSSIGSSLRRRFWPTDPPPDALAGQRVVVTGATSGIGAAMAGSLLDLGATVHLVGRNEQKVAGQAARLRREVPDVDDPARVVEEVCDVADLDAVRTWATGLADRVDALHGLVHNAGVMPPERTETRQGHESALATHVLGPHLMTSILAERLVAGPGSVIWMSSGGMYGASLHADDADDIEYRTGDYDGVRAYARTKRMQVELAEIWADRLAGTGVLVSSMHPGWVRTPGVDEGLPRFARLMGPWLRDPADGADTAVWLLATRPEPHGDHHFWHDRAQRPTTFGWQRSTDEQARRRLLDHITRSTEGVSP